MFIILIPDIFKSLPIDLINNIISFTRENQIIKYYFKFYILTKIDPSLYYTKYNCINCYSYIHLRNYKLCCRIFDCLFTHHNINYKWISIHQLNNYYIDIRILQLYNILNGNVKLLMKIINAWEYMTIINLKIINFSNFRKKNKNI